MNAVEEAPDFEKSLDFTLQVFSVSLRSDVERIDLDQPADSEPQSASASGDGPSQPVLGTSVIASIDSSVGSNADRGPGKEKGQARNGTEGKARATPRSRKASKIVRT